jgi:acylphosphatase
MSRIHVRVKGIVQGVGYRYFVVRKASTLELRGYVKNCYDGDVELEAEGDEENLKTLIEHLHHGPSLSKVADVQVEWLDEEKGYQSFSLRW